MPVKPTGGPNGLHVAETAHAEYGQTQCEGEGTVLLGITAPELLSAEQGR